MLLLIKFINSLFVTIIHIVIKQIDVVVINTLNFLTFCKNKIKRNMEHASIPPLDIVKTKLNICNIKIQICRTVTFFSEQI